MGLSVEFFDVLCRGGLRKSWWNDYGARSVGMLAGL